MQQAPSTGNVMRIIDAAIDVETENAQQEFYYLFQAAYLFMNSLVTLMVMGFCQNVVHFSSYEQWNKNI